jgi:two-component system sensor histidine kinase BraS/BceS
MKLYLRGHRLSIGLFLLFAGIFALSFALYQLPLAAVLYPTLLCLFFGTVVLTLSGLHARKKHRLLQRTGELPAAMITALPPCETRTEADYQKIVTALCAQCAALEQKSADDLADMVDYYTVWVHQIKTPIAAMRLMLQNESEATRRRLTNELLRIEQYVDMVLAYLRLGAESTDYVFRSCTLDAVLCDVIRKFSGEFIDRKLQLDYTPIEKSVITDEKWLSFVLEQLLSNALKYTQKGGVRIYMGAPDTLCIADSGIGIDSADLPRVFEKGYTGCNGRKDKHASGLGLYLCRRICKNLGIDMAITSVLNEGTTVSLSFGEQHLTKV